MEDNSYSINRRAITSQINVIEVRGELTAAAERDLLESYTQATDSGAQIILLGFDQLNYLNSAGIGLLVRLVMRAQRQSQQLLAYGLREHYQRIFELTRLQEVIKVYESEAAALASLTTNPAEKTHPQTLYQTPDKRRSG